MKLGHHFISCPYEHIEKGLKVCRLFQIRRTKVCLINIATSSRHRSLHAVYLIPATTFEGLVLFYLLTVIYDVTVTIKIYLVT